MKNLTSENFHLEAAKVYRKRLCPNTQAFFNDLKHLDLNKDITAYLKADDKLHAMRLLINKVIIAANLFGPDSVDLILFQVYPDANQQFLKMLFIIMKLICDDGTEIDQTLLRIVNETIR